MVFILSPARTVITVIKEKLVETFLFDGKKIIEIAGKRHNIVQWLGIALIRTIEQIGIM